MASTNKTTNYLLSQFVASDKPSWLADYNGDMLKIDTALKQLADDIDAVEVSIASLSSDVASNTSSINTLNTSVGTHTTDITDLKAQDIIIKNDITNLGTRVTALEGNYPVVEEVTGITITNASININEPTIKCYKYGKVVNLYVQFNIYATSSTPLNAWGDFTCKINGLPLPATPKVMSNYVSSNRHVYTCLQSDGTLVMNNSNTTSLNNTIYPQFAFTYITE